MKPLAPETADRNIAVAPWTPRRPRWLFGTEYEVTREGIVYFIIIALIAVASLNTGNNLLFFILAMLLAGILASGCLSAVVLSGVDVDVKLPKRIFAGDLTPVALTVRNLKTFFPSYSLTISSRAARRRLVARRLRNGSAAPRWGILNRPAYAPFIPRRASATQQVILKFPSRGRYGQDAFQVSSKFPFGILRRIRTLPARHDIVVLPGVEAISEFREILAGISRELEGWRKGRGADLYAIRDYQEGDSARHVDWKASAKTRTLKVREFADEKDLRLTLVLDPWTSVADTTASEDFERAVSFCASLAWHFFQAGLLLQFVTEDFQTAMAPACEVIDPILEALALIQPRAGQADELVDSLHTARRTGGFPVFVTTRPLASLPSAAIEHVHVVTFDV